MKKIFIFSIVVMTMGATFSSVNTVTDNDSVNVDSTAVDTVNVDSVQTVVADSINV